MCLRLPIREMAGRLDVMSGRIKGCQMSEADAAELLNAMVPLFRIRPVIDNYLPIWRQLGVAARTERQGMGAIPHGDARLLRGRAAGPGRAKAGGRRHSLAAARRQSPGAKRGGGCCGKVSTDVRNGVRRRATIDAAVDTELLCGRFLFETSDENPLIAALPDEIILRTAGEPLLKGFGACCSTSAKSWTRREFGSEMVAADLARALFVMMLRDHLTDQASGKGTLSLLQDRATARVVLAILGDLARDWTLDEMAAVAIASRATLVRAFQKRAGIAPMTFLSDLRLAVARKRLAGTSDPIAKIADEVGYASESALSKAIMRKYGMRPGALRLAVPNS